MLLFGTKSKILFIYLFCVCVCVEMYASVLTKWESGVLEMGDV